MEFLPPVVAHLIADIGEFSAGMGAAKAEVAGLQAANARLAAAGKVAMAALAVGVAVVGYESVKTAAKFDQTMELVHTQAGAAQSEVDSLKKSVLDLAPAVGIGPEKLAEGLYHIESTGFRGKAALDILTASAKLAALGLADLDTVTFAMSGVMSVGMKDIRSAADATNYLNTIVGMGDMRMDKLAAAIGTGVLPSFKAAGLGMTDFGASLAVITDNSTNADEAATRLRMTVSMMAAPTGKAKEALASIGITSTQLAEDMRKPNGLLIAVMDLKTHLEQSGKTASEQNAIIAAAFGGGRSSGAIHTLLEESDRLKSKYGQLGTEATRAAKADEAWKAQQQQFSQQMHQLGAEAQVLGVKIGEWIIPKLQASASWLAKHIGVVKIAAVVIGAVLVAAIGAWTAAVIANTVAMLANPMTWIILAIIAAIALLAIGIYELVKHWSTVWGFIKRIALDVWHALVDAWHWTWNVIKSVVWWIHDNIVQPIVNFFDKYFVKPLKIILNGFAVFFKFVWGFLSVVLKDFGDFWASVWHGIVSVIMWVHNNVMLPISRAIQDKVIKPIQAGIAWLRDYWDASWKRMGDLMRWVHDNVIKPVSDFIQKYAINPVKSSIATLESAWHSAWNGIKSAIDWVWGKIEPIFNKIMTFIGKIKSALTGLVNAPGQVGGQLAHLVGFDQGGWIPGPPGAPQLIVAHGGEYMLSRDMIASGQAGTGGPALARATPLSTVHDGEGRTYIEAHIYIDGTKVHRSLIPVAQQYKRRNGVTGLS
jgi:TP901 family phage tail tape measure protein